MVRRSGHLTQSTAALVTVRDRTGILATSVYQVKLDSL